MIKFYLTFKLFEHSVFGFSLKQELCFSCFMFSINRILIMVTSSQHHMIKCLNLFSNVFVLTALKMPSMLHEKYVLNMYAWASVRRPCIAQKNGPLLGHSS